MGERISPSHLADGDSLSRAVQDRSVVFHAAAPFRLWGDDELFMKANVEGVAYVVSDGEDGILRQVLSDLLATQNTPAPQGTVPFSIAWFMARILEMLWRGLSLQGEPR